MAILIYITIDCKDARRLGAFWSAALDDYTSDESGIVLRSSKGPNIYLQEVPEEKTGKNPIHLDIAHEDPKAEVFRLTRLGASVVEEKDESGAQWTIMADPEGNLFCVTPAP